MLQNTEWSFVVLLICQSMVSYKLEQISLKSTVIEMNSYSNFRLTMRFALIN